MGVRLYPQTKDAATLERLAGVPEGTMRLLNLHEEMVKVYMAAQSDDGEDVGYDIYCLIKDTPVQKLEEFLLFGWGKFDYSLLPAEMREEPCGDLPANELAARILLTTSGAMPHWDLQDASVFVHLSGGVTWG